jgi:hypothetical protein
MGCYLTAIKGTNLDGNGSLEMVSFGRGRVHSCICAFELASSAGQDKDKEAEGGKEKKMLYSRRFCWEWTPNVHNFIMYSSSNVACAAAGDGDIFPLYSKK